MVSGTDDSSSSRRRHTLVVALLVLVELTVAMDRKQNESSGGKRSGICAGAARLASDSPQRDRISNGRDQGSTAEFAGGCRDGLHDERDHDYYTTACLDGYNAAG